MTYATRADMEARFGADEALDLAGADAARIEAALADATAAIDAALAAAYRLPLGAGPSGGTPAGTRWPRLVAVACDLARRALYDDVSSAEVSARAELARQALARLASGEEALLDVAGRVAPRRDRADRTGVAAVMTPDNLAGL